MGVAIAFRGSSISDNFEIPATTAASVESTFTHRSGTGGLHGA